MLCGLVKMPDGIWGSELEDTDLDEAEIWASALWGWRRWFVTTSCDSVLFLGASLLHNLSCLMASGFGCYE